MSESTCARLIVAHGASDLRAALAPAAISLQRGELVVFPTETVYGLGAHALDERAVACIFRAKRRPVANPLIVHVNSVALARSLAASWPEIADKLAASFWPGPLTMVLHRSDLIPDIVTAGGPTVALRMPDHPIALTLIELANVPLAAPSANPSGMVSPTRAEHLHRDIIAAAAYVVDGGPCRGGIESTVVDLTQSPPAILRPGLVSRSALVEVLGQLATPVRCASGNVRSPGALGPHYAPRAPLLLAGADTIDRAMELAQSGTRTVALAINAAQSANDHLSVVAMPADAASYAERLYDALVSADASGAQVIIAEMPPADSEWEGVRDRLSRAALR